MQKTENQMSQLIDTVIVDRRPIAGVIGHHYHGRFLMGMIQRESILSTNSKNKA